MIDVIAVVNSYDSVTRNVQSNLALLLQFGHTQMRVSRVMFDPTLFATRSTQILLPVISYDYSRSAACTVKVDATFNKYILLAR